MRRFSQIVHVKCVMICYFLAYCLLLPRVLPAEDGLEKGRQVLAREQERTVVAVDPRPSASEASEVRRDGRFIAYSNGTVLDTKTNLMWAARDNGERINWSNAKNYCESYRGGGYSDWRMPTQDELAGLYDSSKTYNSDCGYEVHLTELIHLTCTAPWASEKRRSEAAYFDFLAGDGPWFVHSGVTPARALPVRSGR